MPTGIWLTIDIALVGIFIIVFLLLILKSKAKVNVDLKNKTGSIDTTTNNDNSKDKKEDKKEEATLEEIPKVIPEPKSALSKEDVSHGRDFKISVLVAKYTKILSRINFIENAGLLNEQRRTIEIYSTTVMNILLSHFQDILREKLGADKIVSDTDEFKHYTLLTRVNLYETRSKLIKCCLENHLAEKTGVEWEKYKSENVSIILTDNIKFSESYFLTKSLLSREEVNQRVTKELGRVLQSYLIETFDKIKVISVQYSLELEKLYKELDTLCEENNLINLNFMD